MKKGKLTETQREIYKIIPRGKWFSEFELSFRICKKYRNVCSHLRKMYEKGYLDKKCSKSKQSSFYLFDYKVKE